MTTSRTFEQAFETTARDEEQKETQEKLLADSRGKLRQDTTAAQKAVNDKFGSLTIDFSPGADNFKFQGINRAGTSDSAGVKDRNGSNDRAASGDKSDDKARPGEKSEALKRLEEKYGVDVRTNGNRYEYYAKVDGKDKLMFVSDASGEGLRQSDRQLKEMVEKRTKELEDKYKIKIMKEGERTVPEERFDEKANRMRFGDKIPARSPKLGELEELAKALEKSQPSNLTGDPKNPMKVAFLSKPLSKDDPAAAFFDPHRRMMMISPNHEKILSEAHRHNGKGCCGGKSEDGGPRKSLSEVLVHEFAHNAQSNTGVEKNGHMSAKLMDELGYAERYDKEQRRTVYDAKAKDGYQYSIGPGKDGEKAWFRRDKDGNYITSNGEKTSDPRKAQQLNNEEMREKMLVKPTTPYFDHPAETMAEALTDLRLGEESRGRIARNNPSIYEVAKKYDQQEIDKFYGKKSDGSSKFVRLPDGRIAENSAASRKKIADFENARR
ncbi:MAG TPA: hypothetical protein V6D17_24025 [Candidatus Obscuribacterales bacterium]